MKHLFVATALLVAVGFAAIHSTATAQLAPDIPLNPKIKIKYQPPKNAKKYGEIAKRLQARQVLEQLSQVLSPLRLQSDLNLVTAECPEYRGAPNSDYTSGIQRLRLCYEMLDFIENGAAVPAEKLKPPPNPNIPIGLHPDVTRGEAIVGGWVGVVLHEAGHAVFDIQKIPRFGKEEDAADQIAAFMMLQFGTDVARVMVKGTYNLWRHMYGMSGGHQAGHYAGVHSIGAQRGANYLCIAYGGEPAALKDLADIWLNEARKENCANEYKQVRLAFRKTFLNYVDEALMAKVRRMAILRPEDIQK